VAARSDKTATFHLTAGTYVAFCNLLDKMKRPASTVLDEADTSDHPHFAEGMHAAFTVSDG
jgi:hypothetical protein